MKTLILFQYVFFIDISSNNVEINQWFVPKAVYSNIVKHRPWSFTAAIMNNARWEFENNMEE